MLALTLRKIRPWVQAAAFALFIGLLIVAGKTKLLAADLFFRLDPLVVLANALAARRLLPALLIGAVAALLLAVIAGRAWCGWLCPLGTALDWAPARQGKRFEPDPRSRPRRLTGAVLRRMSETPESAALSRELRRRGWTFVGPTTMYAFMQACGLVNDHTVECFLHPRSR